MKAITRFKRNIWNALNLASSLQFVPYKKKHSVYIWDIHGYVIIALYKVQVLN